MIYLPATINVLTPGHIKALQKLSDFDDVIVGLLTSEALKGYKEERVPFKDREFILWAVIRGIGHNIRVVPQRSLDPTENLTLFPCHYFASGDGYEPVEEAAIKKFGLIKFNIKLDGEKKKQYSSSRIHHAK